MEQELKLGLEGKVALVMGTAGSIGRCIARFFAYQKSRLVLVWHQRKCSDWVQELQTEEIEVVLCQAGGSAQKRDIFPLNGSVWQ